MLLTASVMSLSPSVLDADMASCASISSILVAWTEALKVFCALISKNNFEKNDQNCPQGMIVSSTNLRKLEHHYSI